MIAKVLYSSVIININEISNCINSLICIFSLILSVYYITNISTEISESASDLMDFCLSNFNIIFEYIKYFLVFFKISKFHIGSFISKVLNRRVNYVIMFQLECPGILCSLLSCQYLQVIDEISSECQFSWLTY